MKYLEFDMANMSLRRAAGESTQLISGASNYFGVHINFDEEFEALPGVKYAEFFKGRNLLKVVLEDGYCAIPNDFLRDKTALEMRVISGNMVATPWLSLAITESGAILPETPGDEAPGMEYVKSPDGEGAIRFLRIGEHGLEVSQDGKEWQGVPVDSGIKKIQVDGVELELTDDAVNINLSAYVKTEDAKKEYAAKTDLEALHTLQGEAAPISALDSSETDTAAIAAKINDIIGLLKTRGIASAE